MRPPFRAAAAAAACILAAAHPLPGGDLPRSSLAVQHGGRWVPWWDSARAPAVWSAPDPAVSCAVAWHPAASGIEWGELALAGTGEAWRLQVVLVRLEPARLRLELETANREGGTLADWSLDRIPAGAVLAVNAGQFTAGVPWGWLVRDGAVEQAPARGALSAAFCVSADGRPRFAPVSGIPATGNGGAATAFQSYPVLLRGDGQVPPQLASPGAGVDLDHRDARLALGELRDGRLLLALTRFGGGGPALGSLPFGPTVPEMAAIVGALGCREALMLDGGISAQLGVRDTDGTLHAWHGWRKVPLALVAYPRQGVPAP